MAPFKVISVRLQAQGLAAFTSEMGLAGGAVKRFGEVSNETAKAHSNLGSVLKTVATTGVVAVAAALGVATREAAKFDEQLRNVSSLAPMTVAQFHGMSEALLDMSRHLPQSATELAGALYDVTSSGFAGADALNIVRASATAASAGLSTTATAAQAIDAVLNAYGRSAGDAKDISDSLFKAVDVGVLTFDQLATTLGDVVGTAAAAGVDINAVNSALATMTLSGVSAAESGTSLNRVLTSFIKPSQAMSNALHNLGFESGVTALQSDGLRGVMTRLATATGGQVEAIQALFPDMRALRGALALLSADGANYARVSAEIESAEARTGATQRALAEQAKGFSFQLKLLKNDVNAAAIEIGQRLLPVGITLMQNLESLGRQAVPVLSGELRRLTPFFAAVGDTAGNLGRILAALGRDAAPLAATLAALGHAGVIGGITALATALATLTGFLDHHRSIVQALAVAYLVSLVPGMVAAAAGAGVLTVAGNLLADAWLYVAASTSKAVAGLQILGVTGSLSLAALTVGVTQFANSTANANAKVDEFRRAFANSRTDAEAFAGTYADLWKVYTEAQQKADKQNTGFGTTLKGMIQIVTPLKNTVVDNALAAKKLGDEYEAAGKQIAAVDSTVRRVMSVTGLNEQAVFKLAKALGVDLVSGGQKGVDTIAAYARTTQNATAPTVQLREAAKVLGDVTSSAADKVKALKDALDAFIGIHVAAVRAEVTYQQSLADLSASIKDVGTSLDPTTEAGRKNLKVVADLADAITGHVEALQNEGSSLDDVHKKFDQEVDDFRKVALAAGLTKAQVEALVQRFGLVPSSVDVVFTTSGANDTVKAIDAITGATNTLKTSLGNALALVTTLEQGGPAGAALQSQLDAIRAYEAGKAAAAPPPPTDFSNFQRRALGGIDSHVVSRATVLYGERQTGGEAFVPKVGSRARAMATLSTAAGWYGARVTPMAAGGVLGPTASYVAPMPSQPAYGGGLAPGEVTAIIERAARLARAQRPIEIHTAAVVDPVQIVRAAEWHMGY